MFPGSFDPLHTGHVYIIKKTKPVLELSINRRSKDTLSLEEIMKRCAEINQYVPGQIIAITNSAWFRDKIRIFGPDKVFCMGTDTWDRLVDDDSLINVARLKCHFNVFQRGNSKLTDITLTPNSTAFEVPEQFRFESSSNLRRQSC